MPVDPAQLETDVNYLTETPSWQDADNRRAFVRDVALKTRAANPDPEYQSALMKELWNRVDDRGRLRKGVEFAGSVLAEVVKSAPAAGGAAVFGVADAAGITDTGSATRLKTGALDLLDSTRQRIKSWVPNDTQEDRDKSLELLRLEIDSGATPKGLESWLAGDLDTPDAPAPDPETAEWITALTRGIARKAVIADSGPGADIEQRIDAWLASDRNPAATQSGDGTPGPRELLADYVATYDPSSWDAFQNRIREPEAQHRSRAERFVAESTNRQVLETMPEGLAKEMVGRSQDMQASPIDLASAALPIFRGAKALQAARAGESAVLQVAKGAVSEAVQEGATTYFGDARASNEQVLMAAAMGAVGSGLLEGGMATAGRLMRGPLAKPGDGPAEAADGPTRPPMRSITIDGQDYQFDPTILTPDLAATLTGPELQPFIQGGAVMPVAAAPAPAQVTDGETVSPGFEVGADQAAAGVGSAFGQSLASQPLAREMPMIPNHPAGGADILDFVNQRPIEMPRLGTSKAGEYDFREQGDLPAKWRRYLMREGPGNIENVARDAHAEGLIDDPSPQALIDKINEAVAGREQWQPTQRQQEANLKDMEAQAVRWEKDQSQRFNRQGDARQSVPTDRLGVGDRLQISGQEVRVAEVSFDPNDNLETVILDGGPAFGRIAIDVPTMPSVLAEDYKANATTGPFREGPETAPGATAEDLANATATAQGHWQAALGVPAPEVPVRYATAADKFGPRTLGEMQLTGPTTGTAIINPARPGAMETIAHETAHFLHALAMSLEPRRWAWLSFGNYYTEAEMPTTGAVGKLWTATMTRLRGLPTNRKLMARRRALEKKPRSKWSDMDRHLHYLSDARELWARVVEQIVYYQARGHTMSTSAYGYAFSEVAVLTETEIRAIMPHVRSVVETTTAALDAARGNGKGGSNATADSRPANGQDRRTDADLSGEFAGANVGQVDGPRSQLPNELGGSPISARPAMEGDTARTSQFGERVVDDERLSETLRGQDPTEFAVQPQQDAATTAAEMIRERGLEGALTAFQSEGLPMPVRIAGTMQVMMRYDAQAALMARQGIDTAQMDALADMAAEARVNLETYANDAGRNLAMFNAYARMTPHGVIRRQKRAMARQVDQRVQSETSLTPDELGEAGTEEQTRVLTQGIDELLDELLNDPGVTTPRPVPVRGPNTAQTTAPNMADALKPEPKLFNRILGWTEGALRDFANSATLSNAIQSIDDALKALKGKLFLDPLLLTPLAQLALKATRSLLMSGQRLSTAIANGIAQARQSIDDQSVTDVQLANAMNAAISRQLLKPILTRMLQDPNYTGPQVIADLEAAGLTNRKARNLVQKVRNKRTEMVRKMQERVKKNLLARLGPKNARVKRTMPRVIDILTQAVTSGVWTGQDVRNAFIKAFNLPTLSAAQEAKLADLAAQVMALPEGVLRNLKQVELQNEIGLIEGIPAADVLMSAWYANILAGLSTQGINVWGNTTNMLIGVFAQAASSPGLFTTFLKGLAAGWKPGIAAAKAALMRNQLERGLKLDDTMKANGLELMTQQGGPKTGAQLAAYLMSFGGATRYIFRALAAVDAVFRHTAHEGHAHLALARTLRRQGLKPGTAAFRAEFIRQLGGDEAQMQADLDQARTEMQQAGQKPDPVNAARRALEIRQARRSVDNNQAAQRWADRMTFQIDPEGIGEYVSKLIGAMQGLVIAGIPVGRLVLVPFNKVVSNFFERSLDLTPIGAARGLLGRHITGKKSIAFDDMERRERFVTSILGMSIAGLAYGLSQKGKDEPEEDVKFRLYGSGPPSKNARDQMPKRWRPYTIKIGDTYWSYAETPLNLMLAAVGGMLDAERYSKKTDTTERATVALTGALRGFNSQGVLSSLANVMELFDRDVSAKKIVGTSLRFAPGAIPAQGLLRDISTLFDPNKIADDAIWSSLVKDIPVVKSIGTRPQLNALGDPVEVGGLPVVRRIAQNRRPDPDTDWLGRHKLLIPALPDRIELGDYILPGASGIDWQRKAEALKLTALENGVMTPEQSYQWAKRTGQLTKEGVQRLRTQTASQDTQSPEARAALQSRVNAIAEAARKVAMLEMVKAAR